VINDFSLNIFSRVKVIQFKKSEKPKSVSRYLLRSDYQRKRMKVLKYFNFASPIFASQVNELYPEDQIGLVIPWT